MKTITQEITNKSVWESFLATHSPQALFQSWLWGQVQKAQGQDVERIGFYKNGAVVAIAQIACIKARRGTFLHIRHGPIASVNDQRAWREIIELLIDKAKKTGAWFVRMSPLLGDTPQNKIMLETLGLRSAPIHAMDGELCWVVDLIPTEGELLMNMRKTTRYEIRQAQKIGVEITLSNNSNDLNHFNLLYEQTARRHGFIRHTGIAEEFEFFARNKQAVLYQAYHEKELLAVAIILYHNRQAIYHHSASLPTKIPAMSLLLWKAMCDAKMHECTRFNFWGVAPEDKPNHPWRGISLFKRGFGGQEERFLHAHDIQVSPLYAIAYSIETFRRWKKGY